MIQFFQGVPMGHAQDSFKLSVWRKLLYYYDKSHTQRCMGLSYCAGILLETDNDIETIFFIRHFAKLSTV